MYSVDELGEKFEQMTLQMKPDREGDVFCTLVRMADVEKYHRSVLYIHGFSDYFFQKELAEQFQKNGYNFYALDLRKCGRSIRPWQTPYNLYDISDYYEDIDAAVCQIKKETKGRLVLLGHSTGGLALSLYAHNRPAEPIDAMILNSPFLELNITGIKKMLIPVVSFLSRIFPNLTINKGLSLHYGNSISKKVYGEWEFNENWKPLAVSKINAVWLRAIHNAHVQVHKGLDIKCPVLVMSSDKSFKSKYWSEEFKKADAVLNVEHIRKYSSCLCKNITNVTFKDGLHDLILSAPEVREQVYITMFKWLSGIMNY
ncbi:MAG: alpha/beta hydrolase [Prevotellaceae bacterium]|jgi:alpha-beta hydrolase superfamily lysophospholipase|nr:alpha/beta hydrolase [Prevotellaceae bacterium]